MNATNDADVLSDHLPIRELDLERLMALATINMAKVKMDEQPELGGQYKQDALYGAAVLRDTALTDEELRAMCEVYEEFGR